MPKPELVINLSEGVVDERDNNKLTRISLNKMACSFQSTSQKSIKTKKINLIHFEFFVNVDDLVLKELFCHFANKLVVGTGQITMHRNYRLDFEMWKISKKQIKFLKGRSHQL